MKKGLNQKLSVEPFINYLRNLQKIESGFKQQFIEDTIGQFTELLKFSGTKDSSESNVTRRLLDLTDKTLSFKFDHTSSSFAIYTMPAWDELIFIRENLPGVLEDAAEREAFTKCVVEQFFEINKLTAALYYRTIWNHLVDFPSLIVSENVISYQSLHTGQLYYFQLCPDFKFIDIQSQRSLNHYKNIIEDICAVAVSEEDTLQKLISEVPMSDFEFSGFGRFSVTDVTVQHIIRLIERQVESSDHYTKTFSYLKDVHDALRIISRTDKLSFGLLLMFELNGQFLFNEHISELELNSSYNESSKKNLFDYLVDIYRLRPYRLYLKDINDELAEKYEYLSVHKKNGVQSFALVPILYHQRFVGVLEVVTKDRNNLSNAILGRLEAFIPVLSSIFNKSIENLKQNIEAVIKMKFTSLQPCVQWRFNQAAYQYLQNSEVQTEALEIEDVAFNQVYPIYGAVDIKDSTVKRNDAFRRDAIGHLNLLLETLAQLKNSTSFGLLEEKIADCKKWQELVSDELTELSEGELNYFFENDIYIFLLELTKGKPETASITEIYFNALSDVNGPASINRHALEKSINTVVGTINDLIDELNDTTQKDFPCFFEKFRTDGVEYDIYAGQSIAPDRPFNHIFIKNIRFLQLANMITIANRSHLLQSQIQIKIEITQLIFVNPNFIDIRFRRDERRFDVEGAYNIRYHIVKKRIDKVHIKNTNERLTAPGKIAIVYTSQKEADEYMVHCRYLQGQNLLMPEIEILELEQLQGVVGLKALRVTVSYQQL